MTDSHKAQVKPIIYGVVPAGGLGTRFLPITRSVPKELLPVIDTAVIELVVQELTASGIQRVVVEGDAVRNVGNIARLRQGFARRTNGSARRPPPSGGRSRRSALLRSCLPLGGVSIPAPQNTSSSGEVFADDLLDPSEQVKSKSQR